MPIKINKGIMNKSNIFRKLCKYGKDEARSAAE